jgi:hypothetical protein
MTRPEARAHQERFMSELMPPPGVAAEDRSPPVNRRDGLNAVAGQIPVLLEAWYPAQNDGIAVATSYSCDLRSHGFRSLLHIRI